MSTKYPPFKPMIFKTVDELSEYIVAAVGKDSLNNMAFYIVYDYFHQLERTLDSSTNTPSKYDLEIIHHIYKQLSQVSVYTQPTLKDIKLKRILELYKNRKKN